MVLDASLTLAWYFDDEASSAVDSVLAAVARGGAIVPPLWRLEVANGFQSAIRRKRIDQRYRDDSLAELRLLPIEIDGESDARVWPSALPLADRFGLSVYDACYLELAQRRELPLATLDARLRSAGAALG
ncbi:MAG: type II toxin-antitoxin system VapC family toxin, partial [Roseiarcus sp.]